MHQTLDLSSDFSSVCRPHTAGGHSHKAPAISEVMRFPEATGEAYSFATTVTLYLSNGDLKTMNCLTWKSLLWGLFAMYSRLRLFLFSFIDFAIYILLAVIGFKMTLLI